MNTISVDDIEDCKQLLQDDLLTLLDDILEDELLTEVCERVVVRLNELKGKLG